jgi:SAM-dependent methyltransferase
MRAVTIAEYASLFGVPAARVEQSAGAALSRLPLAAEPLEGRDRDELMLQAMKRILAPELKNAGEHRLPDWEQGWAENRDAFAASGYKTEELIPRYYRPGAPIRLNGNYCRTSPPDFVYRYTELFRGCLFEEYFSGLPMVYEFGCGTGHNLVHLARLGLVGQLCGLDWARPSQDIMTMLREQLGLPVTGRRFDFFNPDPDLSLRPGSGVLTFGALEQVGANHDRLLRFLLEQKPAICLDVAGIEELYDESDLVDYLGLAYHRRRGYLSGYLTALRRLEHDGRVEILKVHRHRFGNQFDDPYSYVAWKPH